MLSNKDIRVENGNLIINGVKYPLDTSEIKEEVAALTETVGDETGGLVKDVSDIEAELETKASITYVDDLLKTEYVSTEIATIGANGNTSVSLPLTIPTGYVPIGCLQFLTSTRSAAITGAWINTTNGTVNMNCSNLSSEALSNVTVAATVGHIRSNS